MVALSKLLKVLADFPAVQASLTVEQLLRFIDICCHLRPELDLNPSNNRNTPPLHLPDNVATFLCSCIFSVLNRTSRTNISLAWDALSSFIWTMPFRRAPTECIDLFLEHGPKLYLAWHTIGPPTVTCLDPDCQRPLTKREQYAAMLFTHDHGPLPIYPSHLYCEKCHCTYYPNYYVHSRAESRTYYEGYVPEFVHVSQRYFVDKEVCETHANMMAMSWSSATNCARVYNLSIGDYTCSRQHTYGLSNTEMTSDHVWDAFFIYGLILEASRSDERLSLPNKDTQHHDRYAAALQLRNNKYQGPSRPGWNHCCNLCARIVNRAEGRVLVRSVVVDGVTIGHPCCASHDCKNPLESQRDRYCSEHALLEEVCAVEGCNVIHKENSKFCNSPVCLEAERAYTSHSNGNAMFQLKHRLAKQRERLTGKNTVAPFLASYAESTEDNIITNDPSEILDANGQLLLDLPAPKTATKRSIKAQFGRKRTHNDELCVSSCGVITGRTTCFGSEGTNGVRNFLHNIYPTPISLPTYIFYDNNCQLLKMLRNRYPDDHLLDAALPVDVFHFQCKHTTRDNFCQLECNPAKWPELMDGDKWVFNSSIAEQTNAWYGGFLAITREMRMERYNFFLDEMIRRRNDWNIAKLSKDGKNPRLLDYRLLLSDLPIDD